jgi:hypothetical protein
MKALPVPQPSSSSDSSSSAIPNKYGPGVPITADGKIDIRAALAKAKVIAHQIATGTRVDTAGSTAAGAVTGVAGAAAAGGGGGGVGAAAAMGTGVAPAVAHFMEEFEINDYPVQVRIG